MKMAFKKWVWNMLTAAYNSAQTLHYFYMFVKGQKISKAIYGVLNSSKKLT